MHIIMLEYIDKIILVLYLAFLKDIKKLMIIFY